MLGSLGIMKIIFSQGRTRRNLIKHISGGVPGGVPGGVTGGVTGGVPGGVPLTLCAWV